MLGLSIFNLIQLMLFDINCFVGKDQNVRFLQSGYLDECLYNNHIFPEKKN